MPPGEWPEVLRDSILQPAELERDARLERRRAAELLWLRHVHANGAADLLDQPIHFRDVVAMRVGEINVLQRQPALLDLVDQRLCVAAGIERRGELRLLVPDQIGVHGHVSISRVGHEETGIGRANGRRIFTLCEFLQ